MCCRHGWADKSNGCDGNTGVPGLGHVCSAPPGSDMAPFYTSNYCYRGTGTSSCSSSSSSYSSSYSRLCPCSSVYALATTCYNCVAGKYLETEGNDAKTDCVLCGPGTYSADEAAAVCTKCDAGKYSNGLSGCPNGWSTLESTCFRFYTTNLDWPTARQRCVVLGGDLASPANQAQQNLLQSLISGYGSAWIGVNDRATEGSWRTADGQLISYSKWCAGEPNDYGGGEDCVETTGNSCWNDHQCTQSRPYFCQTPEVSDPACTPCQAGSYSNASAAVRCASCVAGKYQSTAGVKSVSVRGRKGGKRVWETKGARSREVKKECNIQRCKHTCIYIYMHSMTILPTASRIITPLDRMTYV